MPSAIRFELVPNDQLAFVDQPQAGHWRALGNDGNFYCVPDSGYPIKGGFYLVDLDLDAIKGQLLHTVFYPDYGSGALEASAIPLPRIAGGRKQCIIRFTADVHWLRLDPSVTSCDFTVGSLVIRKLGYLECAVRLLGAIISERDGIRPRLTAFARAAGRFFTLGARGLGNWLYENYSQLDEQATDYQEWIRLFEPDYLSIAESIEHRLAAIRTPVISVIVPVYNTDERWLRACIESVRSQYYPHWELCLANDASSIPSVKKILDEYAAKDARIKVVHRLENGHISAASNSALELATGEYIALLDHDDELHPRALLTMAEAMEAHPQWRMAYSDEDKIDERGRRFDPYFKADYNYDLFLAQNSICHLGLYESRLVREAGGFRLGYEGSQDWDLALRCVERLDPGQIGHVPVILYHWRAIGGSTALAASEKSYAHEAGLKAVADHVDRVVKGAKVTDIPGHLGHYRVIYPLPTPSPRVSLIVPTRDKVDLLRTCVSSILEITQYDNFEILVVDNGSEEQVTLDYFNELKSTERVRVLSYPHPFNYSAINNFAVENTDAEVIGLVNNDIEAISPGWLEEMVSQACRPGVGAVGALLYYPDDTVQHGGVVTGIGGIAGHVHHGLHRGSAGYFSRMALVQNLSAVTAACLLIRRDVYREVGGLDEGLKVAFNDVDFCLRVRAAGYRNLWTPFAELYHHESASRGYEDTPEKVARFQSECRFMLDRWGESLSYDPAYNPNLSLTATPFSLAFPPREAGGLSL